MTKKHKEVRLYCFADARVHILGSGAKFHHVVTLCGRRMRGYEFNVTRSPVSCDECADVVIQRSLL